MICVQGIRTFVVTNYTVGPGREYPTAENEVWSFYPDAQPARSFYPGDDRAALAPFLAHRCSSLIKLCSQTLVYLNGATWWTRGQATMLEGVHAMREWSA